MNDRLQVTVDGVKADDGDFALVLRVQDYEEGEEGTVTLYLDRTAVFDLIQQLTEVVGVQ